MKKAKRKARANSNGGPTPAQLENWVVVGRGSGSTFAKPRRSAKTVGQLRREVEQRGMEEVRYTPEEMASHLPEHVSHLPFKRVKPKVVLDDDVAEVFKDSAAVNKALRKLIEAMPAPPRKRKSA